VTAAPPSAPQFCSFCYRESVLRVVREMTDPVLKQALLTAAERHMRRDVFPSRAAHRKHAGAARLRLALEGATTGAEEASS